MCGGVCGRGGGGPEVYPFGLLKRSVVMISLRKIVITVLISPIADLPFKVETEYTGSTPVKGASQVKLNTLPPPPPPPHTHTHVTPKPKDGLTIKCKRDQFWILLQSARAFSLFSV